jgi:hypothetical protein
MAHCGCIPARGSASPARHLASWAGRCPGNHESGGNRHGGATRKGSPELRVCLGQTAYAAARTKGTYVAAQYRRLAARRGRAKAAIAVTHSILIIVSYLRTEGTVDHDLGAVTPSPVTGSRQQQERHRRPAILHGRATRRPTALARIIHKQPSRAAKRSQRGSPGWLEARRRWTWVASCRTRPPIFSRRRRSVSNVSRSAPA